MKYYIFLLFTVMFLSFQNCSSAGSGGQSANIFLNDFAGGRGTTIDDSTDTGNGDNPIVYPAEYKERLDSMVQLICKSYATVNNLSIEVCVHSLQGDIDFINLLAAEDFVDYDDYNYKLLSGRVGFHAPRYQRCFSYIEQNLENLQAPILQIIGLSSDCTNSILVIDE